MRLARYMGGGDVAIVEEPTPCLPEGGLLVRTEACGLCSGELMDWYMDRKVPHVLGHEVAGIVVESDDERFPVGCRVFPHHHAPCLKCELCQKGLHVHCPQWKATKLAPGGMAEFFAVPRENLNDTLKVDDLRSVDAALIEPLACVVKAIQVCGTRVSRVRPAGVPPAGDEIRKRRGANLPHWTKAGATYFVTYRLADSVPQSVLQEWHEERERLEKRAGHLSDREKLEYKRLHSEQVEKFLDSGYGSCILKNERAAKVVAEGLRHFDGDRYRLRAWCVMPNHVHVVVQPFEGYELSDVIHSWKSFTAKEISRELGVDKTVWQREPYDRLIRKPGELEAAVNYVLRNPAEAGIKNWPWVWAEELGPEAPPTHARDAHATAVIGLGVMGLMHMLMLPRSVGYEINPDRLAWAQNLGLDARSPDQAETADEIFVCPGSREALEFAIKIARPGAKILLFAPMPPSELIPMDLNQLYFKDISILNSYSCGPEDTKLAAQAIRDGKVRAEQVVSDFIELNDLPDAYRAMKSGKILKPMVVFA